MTLEKDTINIGNQERQSMMFTAISWVKYLNGLQSQPPFSYEWYENMAKVVGMKIRKAEEEILRVITL